MFLARFPARRPRTGRYIDRISAIISGFYHNSKQISHFRRSFQKSSHFIGYLLGIRRGHSALLRSCVLRRVAYRPPRRISSSCVPCSQMRPSATTRMREALRMVERRWAMMSVVRPSASCVERVLDLRLRHAVERARGLVQDQDGRILQEDPRDGHALLLPAGQERAALADIGVEAVGHGHDVVINFRLLRAASLISLHGSVRAGRSGCCSQMVSAKRNTSCCTTPMAWCRDSCVTARTSCPSMQMRPDGHVIKARDQAGTACSCRRRTGRPPQRSRRAGRAAMTCSSTS